MAAPRFIDRDDVDSAAMMAAALHSLSKDKAIWNDIGIWGHLPFTVHRCGLLPEQENLAPPGFRTVRCPGGPSCARCTTGDGGYQFRWLSPLWAKAYVAGARPGAWMPGGSEARWKRNPSLAIPEAYLDRSRRDRAWELCRHISTHSSSPRRRA